MCLVNCNQSHSYDDRDIHELAKFAFTSRLKITPQYLKSPILSFRGPLHGINGGCFKSWRHIMSFSDCSCSLIYCANMCLRSEFVFRKTYDLCERKHVSWHFFTTNLPTRYNNQRAFGTWRHCYCGVAHCHKRTESCWSGKINKEYSMQMGSSVAGRQVLDMEFSLLDKSRVSF